MTELEKIGRLCVTSILSSRFYVNLLSGSTELEERRERMRLVAEGDFEKLHDSVTAYTDAAYELACPECGSKEIEQTLRGCLPNTNTAKCGKCGASGIVCEWEDFGLAKAFPRIAVGD